MKSHRQSPRRKRPKQDDLKDALIEQYPGLRGLDNCRKAGGASGSGSGNLAEMDDEASSEDSADEDRAAMEAFDMLEHERMAGTDDVIVRRCDFQAKPRADGDCWQGQVFRDTEAQEWCKRKGLQQTMKFPLKLGLEKAIELSRTWVSRMQFLFDSDKAGLLVAPMVEDTLATWVPSASFKELEEDPDPEVRLCFHKVMSIHV